MEQITWNTSKFALLTSAWCKYAFILSQVTHMTVCFVKSSYAFILSQVSHMTVCFVKFSYAFILSQVSNMTVCFVKSSYAFILFQVGIFLSTVRLLFTPDILCWLSMTLSRLPRTAKDHSRWEHRAAAIVCVQDNHKWNVFFIWREVLCNGVIVTSCQRLSWFMFSSMSCSWQIWARLAWSYLQFGFFACGIQL